MSLTDINGGALPQNTVKHYVSRMAKQRKRDGQIMVRVAMPLRRELELAAAEEGRELSDVARRIWLAWAEQRFAARQAEAA